jgi:hypothetical protein
VELEHRHFERMGEGWENIRQQVDSDKMGWSDLLAMYAAQVGR